MDKMTFQSSMKDKAYQERISDLKETINTLAQNRLPSPVTVVQEGRAEPAPKPIRKAKLPISVVMAKHLDGKKVSPHTIQNAKKSMSLLTCPPFCIHSKGEFPFFMAWGWWDD
ncbi:hypothetical protein, partial [Gluconobacter kondonii]